MFKTRLLSGIVLVLIALVTVIGGGNLLFATVLIISLIGMNELYKVFGIDKKAPGIIGYLGAILFYIGIYLDLYRNLFNENPYFDAVDWPLMLTMVLVILLMASYVFAFPHYKTEQIVVAFFGVFYVAVMLSYIFQTRILPGGVFSVWLVFLCSWGCDTCAYCTGMLIGKHKMAPVLSPKKSIEGAVGGVVGAALLGVLYGCAINHWGGANVSVAGYAIVCAAAALISMVGDLAASAIKRNHEIKDYGTLIPGHGGILDRFDSVIFTAPIIYYLVALL